MVPTCISKLTISIVSKTQRHQRRVRYLCVYKLISDFLQQVHCNDGFRHVHQPGNIQGIHSSQKSWDVFTRVDISYKSVSRTCPDLIHYHSDLDSLGRIHTLYMYAMLLQIVLTFLIASICLLILFSNRHFISKLGGWECIQVSTKCVWVWDKITFTASVRSYMIELAIWYTT